MAYTPPSGNNIAVISVPNYDAPNGGDVNVVMGKLAGWENAKYLDLTISASDVESTLTNFPILLNLSDSSGKDVSDSYTKLLIHSDTTDGSTIFTDGSSSSHAITANGNTHHETDQKKFGDTSIYFDGTGDYLSIPDHDDWTFGSGDFTIDFWVQRSRTGVLERLCGQYLSGSSRSGEIIILVDNRIQCNFYSSSLTQIESTGTITDTNWHHIAYVRDGNTITLYIDGIADGTANIGTQTHVNVASTFKVGVGYLANYFLGYIDEFRISKGIARWTSNFTPETLPYARIDVSVIFDELSATSAKSVIFDITDCWGSSLLGVRSIEFSLDGVKHELTTSDLTGYASSTYSGYNPSIAFDTVHSKVGSYNNTNSWLSNNVATNVRLIVVFNDTISFNDIILNNFHNAGTQTNIGIKNVKVTVSPSAITDTTYNAAISDGIVINESVFPEHIASNAIDNQIVFEERNNKKIALQQITTDQDSSTKLLIFSDTTDGNTTFTDDSSNNHTITANGDTHHEVDQKKFGDTSIYFDGTGDYLTVPDHADFELGSNNFTIECWVYLAGYSSNNGGNYLTSIITKDVENDRGFDFAIDGSASSFTTINFSGNSNNTTREIITETYSFSLNTWYHIAAVRNGNLIYLFVDGICLNPSGTSFTTTIQNTSTTLKVGALEYNTTYKYYLTGYIDDLRISNGIARYTSNFTPDSIKYDEQCYMEIERWDQSNEEAQIWAKIPYISNSGDTKLRLYFDKDCVDNTDYVGDSGDTVAQNVWDDNFVAVYHMGQDPSGGTNCILDSTSNINHGTPAGGMLSSNLVDGPIGKAIYFDGSNDVIDFGSNGSLDTTIITLETTFKRHDVGWNNLIGHATSSTSNYDLTYNTAGVLYFQYDNSGWQNHTTSNVQSLDTWYNVAVKHDGSNITFAVDGISETPATSKPALQISTPNVLQAGHYQFGSGGYSNITEKETRLSNTARSEEWLETTQKSNTDNLITFGEDNKASYEESTNDTFSFSDTATAKIIIGVSASDTINFTDASIWDTAVIVHEVGAIDTFSFIDSADKNVHFNPDSSDTINFTDISAPTFQFILNTEDTIIFSDTSSIAKTFNPISSDSFSFTDNGEGNYLLFSSDNIEFSTTADNQSLFFTSSVDGITFSESYTENKILNISVSDNLVLSENVRLFSLFTAFDNITFEDSSGISKFVSCGALSNFDVSDIAISGLELDILLSESIIFNENIQTLITYNTDCYDNIIFSDSTSCIKIECAEASDSFNLSDSSSKSIIYTLNSLDSFILNDSNDIIGLFISYGIDNLNFSDNSYGTLPGVLIPAGSYDVINFTYSSEIEVFLKSPGEMGFADVATVSNVYHPLSSDNVILSDVSEVQLSLNPSTSDIINMGDSAVVFDAIKIFSGDNVSVSDIASALISKKNLKNVFKSCTKNGIDGSTLYTSSNGKSVIMHISVTNTSAGIINIDMIVRRDSTNYYLINDKSINISESFVINNNTMGDLGLTNNLIKDDEIIINCTPSGNGDAIISLIEI